MDVDSVQSIECDIFSAIKVVGVTRRGGRELALVVVSCSFETFFGGGVMARWTSGGVAKIDFIT